MPLMHRSIILCGIAVLCACKVIPQNSLPAGDSIKVGHPEVFDNAQLQASLDRLRGQLAGLGIVDTSTLTGALGAVQGTSLSQTNFSAQVVGRATPSVTSVVPSISAPAAQDKSDTVTTSRASQTPTVPAAASAPTAPTLPAVTSDAIGLIEKQMQLESQLQGYELLLGGSDFARYTISGLAKDRVVIGFPITISAQDQHKNMAAEVEFTYFPPNANQFKDYRDCTQEHLDGVGPATKDEQRFSDGDGTNAQSACREQEATPTIINILPAERSYNVVGVSSKATSLGAAAIVGTVSLGASGGSSKQTQYLLAQQDTVALQGEGKALCEAGPTHNPPVTVGTRPGPGETVIYDPTDAGHCVDGSRGVRFKWQFRPVLGESFVRPGRRVTFVQLAIPNVRRPYPNYGGIIYVRKTWKPIDTDTGVVKEASPAMPESTDNPGPEFSMKYVLGHTFISSEVYSVGIPDLGSGSVLVSLRGTYLTGATVRIAGTILNPSSPGFIADYNSLQFVTTVQALAQSGATLISSEGVESPINISSVCKSWDKISECALEGADNPGKLEITGVSVSPVSDSTSLIRVELAQPTLRIDHYHYFHYQKIDGDVAVSLYQREPDTTICHQVRQEDLEKSLRQWPVVLTVGAKTYGFSDLPFQSMTEEGPKDTTKNPSVKMVQEQVCGDDGKFHSTSVATKDQHVYLSVVATNDSLNASPEVRVQRLFGNPGDDSAWRSFVPPGRLTIAADPHCSASKQGDSPQAANGKQNKDGVAAEQDKDKDKDQNKDKDKDKQQKSAAVKAAVPCGYVISGAGVEEMQLVRDSSKACKVALDDPSAYERNARGLKVDKCARQIALSYKSQWNQRTFVGEIVLPIPAKTDAPATPPADTTPGDGPPPHFQMVRSGPQVFASVGLATATVGIQNLKDQSATVSVQNADIVTATDGLQNALAIQAGNKIVVTQDTNIFLQVRNFTSKGFNVQAEGKNGSTSAGKLKFIDNFTIAKDAGGSPGTAHSTNAGSGKP
jgi:hypothetical protein